MYKVKDMGLDIYVWDWVVCVCYWGIVVSFIINYFIVELGWFFYEIVGYVGVVFIFICVVWGLCLVNFNKKGFVDYVSFFIILLSKQVFREYFQYLKYK